MVQFKGCADTRESVLWPYSLMVERPSYTRLSTRFVRGVGSTPTRATTFHGYIAQRQEAGNLKSPQCRFDSDCSYQFDER